MLSHFWNLNLDQNDRDIKSTTLCNYFAGSVPSWKITLLDTEPWSKWSKHKSLQSLFTHFTECISSWCDHTSDTWTLTKMITSWRPIRRGVITYPISISDIWKLFQISEGIFSHIKTCRSICLYARNMKVNVSDIAFQISFQISEKLSGFVMTLHLMYSLCWIYDAITFLTFELSKWLQHHEVYKFM